MREVVDLNYELLIPEYVLGVLAVVILAVDLFWPRVRKEALPYIAGGGLLVAFVTSIWYVDTTDDFAGLIFVDDFTTFFRCFFIATTFAIVVASAHFVQKNLRNPGEYYALLVLSTIGAIYMAAARELLSAYISLELLSFSLYVLVSYAKHESRSNEAGMKYMLLGAFASALLLYGISFIYGTAGSTSYSEIEAAFADGTAGFTLGTLIGLTLIVAGLGFKVAAVAAITMMVGNLVALQQHNVKRLLAYSSIGQVGYMLMGIVAISPAVSSALLLHLTGYVITNVAAFTAIIAYNNASGAEEVREFRGMSDRSPLLAAELAVALFSLAGVPLFAGFLTKFILFQSVAENGYFLLAALAVVASLISLYYYLYLLKEMYVSEAPEPGRLRVPLLLQCAVVVLGVGVFFVGLYPAPLFEVTDSAAAVLFS